MAYWRGEQYVIESFLEGRTVVVSPAVVLLLARLTNYTSRSVIEEWINSIGGDEAMLDNLIDHGLVVVRGSTADRRDRALDTWVWSQPARWFHFATKNVNFESDPERQRQALRAHSRTKPAPSPYLRRGIGDIPLPGAFDRPVGELWQTLRERRTQREFDRKPVDLDTFATVLRWTWGATNHATGELGPFISKTSPSGGARHPIEVYPLVLRVDGLPRGLYHYRVKDQTLGQLTADVTDRRAVELFASQPWVADAAAIFVMTAVVERSMWKYKHPHAYRVVLMDAGHLGQTFHLVCTAVGLAPFTSAAKDDLVIERLLGIDGVSELALYVAAMGWPARRADNASTAT